MMVDRDKRTRVVWDADNGWHETSDEFRLVLLNDGRIHWVRVVDSE